MKKNHAPRSADDPISRCYVRVRGRSGAVRGAPPEPTGVLTRRRFRGTSKLIHGEATPSTG